MIIRAGSVVTMDGPPIENGAVAVSGGRITNVGKFSDISATNSGEQIVDLGEQALLPGLINAHCHLDYTCCAAKSRRQNRSPNGSRRSTRRKRTFRRKITLARSMMVLLKQRASARRQLRI